MPSRMARPGQLTCANDDCERAGFPANEGTERCAGCGGWLQRVQGDMAQVNINSAPVPPGQPIAPPPQRLGHSASSPTLRRGDFAAAIQATPEQMQQQLFGQAARCLELIDANLPAEERVLAVSSASVRPDAPENCLLVLTDRRLIFVAPRPQAVAYRLTGLTKSQAFNGYFFLEGDAGEYSVGLRAGHWADEFERRVFDASALAVLADR